MKKLIFILLGVLLFFSCKQLAEEEAKYSVAIKFSDGNKEILLKGSPKNISDIQGILSFNNFMGKFHLDEAYETEDGSATYKVDKTSMFVDISCSKRLSEITEATTVYFRVEEKIHQEGAKYSVAIKFSDGNKEILLRCPLPYIPDLEGVLSFNDFMGKFHLDEAYETEDGSATYKVDKTSMFADISCSKKLNEITEATTVYFRVEKEIKLTSPNVKITFHDRKVILEWEAIEHAVEYEVNEVRGGYTYGNGTTASLFFIVSGLSHTPGEECIYRVVAKGEADSKYIDSDPTEVKFEMPKIVALTKLSSPNIVEVKEKNGAIRLSWKTVENATGYLVSCSSGYEELLSSDKTNAEVTGLVNGNKYSYSIVAKGDEKNYKDSDATTGWATPNENEVLAKLPTPKIRVNEFHNKATLVWKSVENATSYLVIWEGVEENIVAEPQKEFYQKKFENLIVGNYYSYSIVAKGDGNSYKDSDVFSGKVKITDDFVKIDSAKKFPFMSIDGFCIKIQLDAYCVCNHEVTIGEYFEIMGIDPMSISNDYCDTVSEVREDTAVAHVSWINAIVYCNKRSLKEGLTPCYALNGETITNEFGVNKVSNVTCNFKANGYRLPTQAEWSYAARGGIEGNWLRFSGDLPNADFSDDATEYAWFAQNCNNKLHEVKLLKPNGFGLYDMSGNVLEYCWDWYDNIFSYYYDFRKKNKENPDAVFINPGQSHEGDGSFKVQCGGSEASGKYFGIDELSPSHYRACSPDTTCNVTMGFRVFRTAVEN